MLDEFLSDRLPDAGFHLVDGDRGHHQPQPPVGQMLLESLKRLPVEAEAGGDKHLGVERNCLHDDVVRHDIDGNGFEVGSELRPTRTTGS